MAANVSDLAAAASRPNFQAQKSGGVAYCPGYTDADGNWNNGFPCKRWGGPDENYCCGDESKRYCCPDRGSESYNQDSNQEETGHYKGSHQKGKTVDISYRTPATKSRSQSRPDHEDIPRRSGHVNFDTQGHLITPSFVPQHVDNSILHSLNRISESANFPLIPAIIAFSVTSLFLLMIAIVLGCYFCPGCPGTIKRQKKREKKASKFIKTTTVNLEAEETAAAIAAQALVSVTAGGDCNTYSTYPDSNPYCIGNTMGKGHNVMSGSSSTTSSLPRGCADFGCRGGNSRHDNLSDQISTISPGCFHHKTPCVLSGNKGLQLKPHHSHMTEQLVDSTSSLGLVGPAPFMRNSPTTTTTSNSSDGLVNQNLGNQSYTYLVNNSGLHCGCDLRSIPPVPNSMDVENFVNALYQNNQHSGIEMRWKPELENLLNMSTLAQDLNEGLLNSLSGKATSAGMDDSSIKKWLSSTNQQLTPKRNLFNKPKYNLEGNAEASNRLLDQGSNFMQKIPENPNHFKTIFNSTAPYPDVTQTSRCDPLEKRPFLDRDQNSETDNSVKPDITSYATSGEPGLLAVEVPNCPQLKLTSGDWLPKIKYESSIYPHNS